MADARTALGVNALIPGSGQERVPKRITLALTFVSLVPSMVYASMLPHVFLYLQLLDARSNLPLSSTRTFLGYTVAIFSIAKMVLSPIIGRLCNVLGFRLMFLSLTFFEVCGAAAYALARNRWYILAAYALFGVAGTSSTVCRAYVPRIAQSQEQRTDLLAWLSAGTTFGFCVGPAFGALLAFTPCSPANGCHYGLFSFNEWTAPGWSGMALSLLGICMIAVLPGSQSVQPARVWIMDSHAGSSTQNKQRLALLTIMLQQLAMVLPFSAIEVLVAPVCIAAYGWKQEQIGILFTVGSLCTLPCTFALKPVMKYCNISARCLLMIGMIGQVCALILLDDFQNPIKGGNASRWQFVAGFCAFYFFYAITQTVVFSLFYILFGGHPKCSTWVGLVSSAGSLGRWIWPLVSVGLFDVGAGAVWLTTAAVVAVLGPGSLLIFWCQLDVNSTTDNNIKLNISALESGSAVVSPEESPSASFDLSY